MTSTRLGVRNDVRGAPRTRLENRLWLSSRAIRTSAGLTPV